MNMMNSIIPWLCYIHRIYSWWLVSNWCWVYQEDPLISQGATGLGEWWDLVQRKSQFGSRLQLGSLSHRGGTSEGFLVKSTSICRSMGEMWWNTQELIPIIFRKRWQDTEIDSETHFEKQDVFLLRFRHGDGDANLGCVVVWPQWK